MRRNRKVKRRSDLRLFCLEVREKVAGLFLLVVIVLGQNGDAAACWQEEGEGSSTFAG